MAFRMLRPFRVLLLLPSTLLAAQRIERHPVLLIVPGGSEFLAVERARSSVPESRRPLLVGETERVSLRGGLEILVDRTFATAPPADVLVLLTGDPSPAAEKFLLGRRASARVILVPSESSIAKRLKEESGSALIVVGGSEAIPALLGAMEPPPSDDAPPVTRTPTPAPPPATVTPTPMTPRGGVFDRYFSSGSRAAPRSPTPR